MKDLHKQVMGLMEITMFNSMEKTLKCFKKLKKFKEKQANEEVNCNLRGYCRLLSPSDTKLLNSCQVGPKSKSIVKEVILL